MSGGKWTGAAVSCAQHTAAGGSGAARAVRPVWQAVARSAVKGEADTGDAGRAAASGSVADAEGAAVECDGGCDFFYGFFDGVEEFAVEQR